MHVLLLLLLCKAPKTEGIDCLTTLFRLRASAGTSGKTSRSVPDNSPSDIATIVSTRLWQCQFNFVTGILLIL